MKKVWVILLVMFFGVMALGGSSSAWQGRMNGMGNPDGLIRDESDFLIHPAQITFGEGVKYYLDYKFTYTGLIHMDSDMKVDSDPFLGGRLTSGNTREHNTLAGASFPLAKGRMGVFFGYDKQNGDMDSDIKLFGSTTPVDSNADTRLDNYALRLIYGQPVAGMNLGAEFGVAYRNEKQDDTLSIVDGPYSLSLEGIGATLPYMIPFNSSYWEMSGKIGLNKKVKKTDIDWTAYGAGILPEDSDNRYLLKFRESVSGIGGLGYRDEMNGDVSGYRMGTDLWVRYHIDENLSLPFVVSAGYTKKQRDGDGFILPYAYGSAPFPPSVDVNLKYKDVLRTLNIKAGGGVEKECPGCGLIGAGLYYNYIQSRDRLDVRGWGEFEPAEDIEIAAALLERGGFGGYGGYGHGYFNFPYHQEHRLVLNIAAEQIIKDLTVRGGLDFFYGWIRADNYGGSVNYTLGRYYGSGNISPALDGRTWGVTGSLGATKNFRGLTFEPFIRGGYQFFDTNRDGWTRIGDTTIGLDKKKTEWISAGGLSVLFGK